MDNPDDRIKLALLNRILRRKETESTPNSETGVYQGYSYGFAQFRTSLGNTVKVPIANVITRKNYTGTFLITRPENGQPSAHKEV